MPVKVAGKLASNGKSKQESTENNVSPSQFIRQDTGSKYHIGEDTEGEQGWKNLGKPQNKSLPGGIYRFLWRKDKKAEYYKTQTYK